MPDFNGLVEDSRFQALPPDRQRALLERMGADPALIDRVLSKKEVQPPPSGAEERFVKGVVRTSVPSLDAVKEIAKAAPRPPVELDIQNGRIVGLKSAGGQLAWNMLKGIGQQSMHEFGQAAEAGREGDHLGQLRHTAAGLVPGIGPQADASIQKMEGGDVAGGAGELTGLALPLVLPSKLGVGKPFSEAKLAARTEKAGKMLGSAMGASANEMPKIVKNVEYLAGPGGLDLSPWRGMSREQMLEKLRGEGALSGRDVDVTSPLGRANVTLEKTKADIASEPVDVQPVASEIRSRKPVVETQGWVEDPETMEIAPDTTSTHINNPRLASALENRARNMEELATKHGIRHPEIPGGPMGPEPLPGEARYIENVPGHGQRINPPEPGWVEPGTVPAGKLLKVREDLGHEAAAGGAFKERGVGAAVGPVPEAAKTGYGILTDSLHQLFPKLAKADFDYSTLRKAGNILENSVRMEAASNKPGALQVMALKTGMKGAVGAALGGVGAALAGAPFAPWALGGAAGYGVWQIAKEVAASPVWKTMRASQKLTISRAMQRGDFAKAADLLHEAGGAAAGTSRALEGEDYFNDSQE